MTTSSSLGPSESNLNTYWNPEHPPPSTCSLKSVPPFFCLKSFSLAMAPEVKVIEPEDCLSFTLSSPRFSARDSASSTSLFSLVIFEVPSCRSWPENPIADEENAESLECQKPMTGQCETEEPPLPCNLISRYLLNTNFVAVVLMYVLCVWNTARSRVVGTKDSARHVVPPRSEELAVALVSQILRNAFSYVVFKRLILHSVAIRLLLSIACPGNSIQTMCFFSKNGLHLVASYKCFGLTWSSEDCAA